jgi:glycosyltransferase involved in cell wall biosynthesis
MATGDFGRDNMSDRTRLIERALLSAETAAGQRGGVSAKFHAPSVTVVIPHYNYSEFIGDALLSVREQGYLNLACVVVDDCSDDGHRERLEAEFARHADDRFTLVHMAKNMGQVHAIYRGMAERPSQFLCVLDPDDRYAPDFVERMLAVHLNPHVFCPVVSCDQYLLKIGDGIITATQYTHGPERMGSAWEESEEACHAAYGFHRFLAPTEPGWHWSTTSSIMFRTDALKLIAPVGPLPYKGQGDSWCANGAHMLGGSLLLRQPLVYRGLHTRNDFIGNVIFSMWQKLEREGVEHLSDPVKIDVVRAFFENGSDRYFRRDAVRRLLLSQFQGAELHRLCLKVPQAAALILGEDGAPATSA